MSVWFIRVCKGEILIEKTIDNRKVGKHGET